MKPQRVLVLGGTGRLGHALFRWFLRHPSFEAFATVRSRLDGSSLVRSDDAGRLRGGVDADRFDSVTDALAAIEPDIVINGIALTRSLLLAKDPLAARRVNAEFPHRLAEACRAAGARLIHFSTDGVFDGAKGSYTEEDPPTPIDLYGQTNLLGEVSHPHCVTLRTSIIGHGWRDRHGLVEWFLSRKSRVKGFAQVRFSGFPTIEVARIISEYVIPREDLAGVYHVSSAPISKYELVRLLAKAYGKKVRIDRVETPVRDTSLDSTRFQLATGYRPPAWVDLIADMRRDFLTARNEPNGDST